MNRKNKYDAVIAVAVSLAFIMPVAVLITEQGKCMDTDTIISIELPSQTMEKGETFTASVYVEPSEPIIGATFDYLYFDPTLIQANSVTEGDLFDPHDTFFNSGIIDNVNGTITSVYGFTFPAIAVSDPGYFCSISFTAQQNDGTSLLDLEDIIISNATGVEVSVTINDESVIVGDGGGNGDGDGDGDGYPNAPPVANASGSETSGFVGMYISFNGSLSYDPDEDGGINLWEWDFGDGEAGEGEIIEHLYFEAGIFDVTLTVTDDKGATGIDTINVTIVRGNNPPEKPDLTGPTSGHKNIVYEYTANSTDVDNDTISYIFNWGDGETTTTEYLVRGIETTQKHSWNAAGIYTIQVQVTDNQTFSQITRLVVMIDAINVGDIGYFTDDDGDGAYDMFHGDQATTDLGVDDDGSYLIDVDGDGDWDYTFDLAAGLEMYQEEEQKKTPGFELILVLVSITFLLLCIRCCGKKIE